MAHGGSDTALLVQFDGDVLLRQWVLNKEVMRIGRLPDNDIVIDDRWVSRHHAEIRRKTAQYVVADLGSKNGTFVNGQRLIGTRRLRDGDLISLAPLYTLTFVDYPATTTLRRQSAAPLVLDPTTRGVRVWGNQLDPPLSQIQYDFLAVLAEDAGRVYTRDEIVRGVWPTEDLNAISDDAINALVHRLRSRLREHEPQHEFIATLRGYGFRLDLP